jgi:hypothetical protein
MHEDTITSIYCDVDIDDFYIVIERYCHARCISETKRPDGFLQAVCR